MTKVNSSLLEARDKNSRWRRKRRQRAADEVVRVARAWLDHHDRGKVPAGNHANLERWYKRREELPEEMREALHRLEHPYV